MVVPVKVLFPPMVCEPAVNTPGRVASAGCRLIVIVPWELLRVRPSPFGVAPTAEAVKLVTKLLDVPKVTHAPPWRTYILLSEFWNTTIPSTGNRIAASVATRLIRIALSVPASSRATLAFVKVAAPITAPDALTILLVFISKSLIAL